MSMMLWRVLQETLDGQCRLITLIPRGFQPPSAMEKLRFVSKVAGTLLCRNIDWIIFDHLNLARVQRLVPKSFQRPYAVILYSVEAWCPLSAGLKRILQGAKVRLAISNYTAQRVTAAHPDIGPIEVCHLALLPDSFDGSTSCPADVPVIHACDASLLERIQPNSVLIVGRMFSNERHKGHDALIETWPSIKARIPDAQLVVVGRGDDVERLRTKASNRGLGDSVLFAGQVTDSTLQAIYKRVAVFSMPSRGEGFGLVYLEAMLHRLPCVGSIHDAAAEIIEDGVTGFLVDQDSSVGLTEAIAGLLENPSRRQEMGNAGYERLQKLFSFGQFRQRLLTVLKPLMIGVAMSL